MSTEPPAGVDNGFDEHIGLKIIAVGPDGGRAQLQITDKLLQPWGIVHGGVYCAIIESLASISGHVWLSQHGGGTVVGVNNNTDFLRAVGSGLVHAESTPLHRGQLTITEQQAYARTRLEQLEEIAAAADGEKAAS